MKKTDNAYRQQLEKDAVEIIRCAACGSTELSVGDSIIKCADCNASYAFDERTKTCSLLKAESDTATKSDIKNFWGDLYTQLYADNDDDLNPEKLDQQLDELEDLFRQRQQSCVVEMPLRELAGKRVLEIGSGGGGHSCIFKRYGATMVSVDITPERIVSTARKLSMIESGAGSAYQADAENLPFRDNSFDIVYSNGVLHHSEDTEKCVSEVLRVLKPGCPAIIMLYSRISSAFMFNILPRGILTGEAFRWPEAEWIGRLTEGKPKFGDTLNPITRVYSKRQMEKLFSEFEISSLRKWSFQFDNFSIPKLTQIRRFVMKALGFRLHPGGILVYGAPIVAECGLELWLGKYLGFGWTIVANKKTGPGKKTEQ
jgi:ubiquinone/menaquinone biosynthesis C-methylase UbiE